MNRDGVLLLGGSGFVGSALTRRFAAEGRKVYVLSRNATSTSTSNNVHILQGSQDDPMLLAKALPHCGTVIHLASATTPGSSAFNPVLELNNLAPTLRFLEELGAYPERHLIFFSSGGTVYGNPLHLPVPEDAPLTPLSYHGAGKVALESLLQAFRTRGNSVTILRPSNAYGPGQSLKSGFGLIRTMLEHARHGTSLDIWGDGENVRDFIYIDDIVEVCTRLVAFQKDNGTFNLGSGIGYSVNQLKDIVEEVTGAMLATTYRARRQTDVREVVLDISRMKSQLSWVPSTEIVDGVKLTWDWVSNQQ